MESLSERWSRRRQSRARIVKRLQANPLLSRDGSRLGIHPTDEAGIEKIPARVPAGQSRCPVRMAAPLHRAMVTVNWISRVTLQAITNARSAVITDQKPLVDDVLFAKTYFALEETGLGYPSIPLATRREGGPARRILRVFSDAYRIAATNG